MSMNALNISIILVTGHEVDMQNIYLLSHIVDENIIGAPKMLNNHSARKSVLLSTYIVIALPHFKMIGTSFNLIFALPCKSKRAKAIALANVS